MDNMNKYKFHRSDRVRNCKLHLQIRLTVQVIIAAKLEVKMSFSVVGFH